MSVEAVTVLIIMIVFIIMLLLPKSKTGNINREETGIKSSVDNNIIQKTSTKPTSSNNYKQKKKHITLKVAHVIDGDTIIAENMWGKIKIRLDAIDCPENDQHWGDVAKYGLIKLVGGKSINIEDHGKDRYGRTLATIFIQTDNKWLNVNERMVTLGHAWVMRAYFSHLPIEREKKLNDLERWAKSKKIGLWKESNPISPWQWRNGAN